MAVEIYKQKVSASFDVSGLGMSVTVEHLPFNWDYRHGTKDEVGAGKAAKWLFEHAPECYGKELTLRWVNVTPDRED